MIDIVIPTYNRPKKLAQCLLSLARQYDQGFICYIVVNGRDKETLDVINMFPAGKYIPIVPEENLHVVGAWNKYFSEVFKDRRSEISGVLWLVDDVELLPYSLEKARECMVTNFPDTDGVIGIHQECPGHPEYTYKPSGQSLIGTKFIERYAEVQYKVCCPDYKHFSNGEFYDYVTSINKFILCKEAVLNHYHPSFIKEEVDDTHKSLRGIVIRTDREAYLKRKKLGLNWGHSWQLINT